MFLFFWSCLFSGKKPKRYGSKIKAAKIEVAKFHFSLGREMERCGFPEKIAICTVPSSLIVLFLYSLFAPPNSNAFYFVLG